MKDIAVTIETHDEWITINGTAIRKSHISMVGISQHDSITTFLNITLSCGKERSWDAGRPDEARRAQKQIMALT